jgi:hypothetical protein
MKKLFAAALGLLFLLSFGFAAKTLLLDKPSTSLPRLLLSFEIKTEAPGKALIVFNNRAGGYFQVPYAPGFRQMTLPIPDLTAPLWGIRLEPLERNGAVTFRNITIAEENGKILQRLDPAQHIESLNINTSITLTNGELRVAAGTPEAHPVLAFKGIFPPRTAIDNLPRVTPAGLGIIWLILGLTTAALLTRMVWLTLKGPSKTGLWLTGVFITVFGARLLCLKFMAVSFTTWDPWDHEAWNLYLPYLDGGLSWNVMFSPCNEHRIFFSRILSLGQFLINGQWDNRFECLFTSALYAALASGLWMMLHRILRGRALTATLLVLAATALPFSWENIIWGLQSQFYFFMGFSLLSLWFLLVPRPFSAQWWFGAFCALCALFTTGSGVVPTIAVAGIVILRVLRGGKQEAKSTLATLAICAAVGFLYTRVAIHEHNYGMITKTVGQGLLVFGRVMSWPLSSIPWSGLFLWLPVSILAVRRIFFKKQVRPEEWFLFGLAGWCVINALGMAVYRGGLETGVISRYSDLSAMFFVVNGIALLLLKDEYANSARATPFMRNAGAIWVVLTAIGLLSTTTEELRVRGIDRLNYQERAKEQIIRFLQDDDLGRLLTANQGQLAYPDPMFLATCLRNEKLRAFLPSSIRPPVPLVPKTQNGFRPGPLQFDLYEKAWESAPPNSAVSLSSFESNPTQPLQFPYLEFEAKGASAANNPLRKYDHDSFYLRLMNPLTKRVREASSVYQIPGDWQSVTFRAPGKTPIVSAGDSDLFRTLTLKQPREKSSASVWGDKLIHLSPVILGVGLLLLVAQSRRNPGVRPKA